MTDSSVGPDWVKLSGSIENYRATRGEARFVFTEQDKTKFGILAIAAGLAGMGGQAMAATSYATSLEEQADYLEFDLAGERIRGWVWRSPFKEGDHVDVVGWRDGSFVELVGVARPVDRTIALYPHCSRGTLSHTLNVAKWWAIATSLFIGGTLALERFVIGRPNDPMATGGGMLDLISLGVAGFTALMAFSLARKWMPYVRAAEQVFAALGLPNPSLINLPKSSKAQRRREDPGEYATFYFRY